MARNDENKRTSTAFKNYPDRRGSVCMGGHGLTPHKKWPKAKGYAPRLAGQFGVHTKAGVKVAGPSQTAAIEEAIGDGESNS